jgi:hypothetical protein
LIARSSIQGDTPSALIQPAMTAGTWFTVSSQANTLAHATITRICAVKSTVVLAEARISRQPMSR